MNKLLFALLMAASTTSFGQTCDFWDLARDRLETNPERAIATAVELAPELAVKTTQATATGAAAATSSVDSPERPRWVALAIEQGLGAENENGGVTLTLSPFDWLAKQRPEGHFDDNGNYVATMGLRAWKGSLSLGNRGEAIDADGDGTAEDPADPKSLSDNVTMEVEYQFFGNRDRRDIGRIEGYRSQIAAIRDSAIELAKTVVDDLQALPEYADLLDALNSEFLRGNLTCDEAVAQLAEAIEPTFVARLRQETRSFNKLTEELVAKIDGSSVWSVAVSATEREAYLGRDQLGISLRGLNGITDNRMFKGSTFVFNLGYSRVESLVANQRDLRAAKLGVEYVSKFDSLGLRGAEAARWAVSLTGEKNWNAPEGAKKSQAVLGWRMDLPISKDVSVPISIKWSNRDELLRDEDEVIGHIGISLNFDSLLGKSGS